jgi:hypothetical protein
MNVPAVPGCCQLGRRDTQRTVTACWVLAITEMDLDMNPCTCTTLGLYANAYCMCYRSMCVR